MESLESLGYTKCLKHTLDAWEDIRVREDGVFGTGPDEPAHIISVVSGLGLSFLLSLILHAAKWWQWVSAHHNCATKTVVNCGDLNESCQLSALAEATKMNVGGLGIDLLH